MSAVRGEFDVARAAKANERTLTTIKSRMRYIGRKTIRMPYPEDTNRIGSLRGGSLDDAIRSYSTRPFPTDDTQLITEAKREKDNIVLKLESLIKRIKQENAWLERHGEDVYVLMDQLAQSNSHLAELRGTQTGDDS